MDVDLLIEMYNDGYDQRDIRKVMGVHYTLVRKKIEELVASGKLEERVWGRNSMADKRRCKCGILIDKSKKECEFCVGDRENEELPDDVLTKCSKELASATVRNALTDAREEQKAITAAMLEKKAAEEALKNAIAELAVAHESAEATRWLYGDGGQFNYDVLEFDHNYIKSVLADNGISEPITP